MFNPEAPRASPTLESRILQALAISDDLSTLAIEVSRAGRLNFSSTQFSLLHEALEDLGAARHAMELALVEHWRKPTAPARRRVHARGVQP